MNAGLPEMIIIDVGDVLLRLFAHLAYRQGLPLRDIEFDTPDTPCNLSIDAYIETVVDALVSHDRAMESLKYLLQAAMDMKHGGMDEKTCDILEVLGTMIHHQLVNLRLYEGNDQPFNYFYTNRGDDWIMLSRFSHAMGEQIAAQVQSSRVGRW